MQIFRLTSSSKSVYIATQTLLIIGIVVFILLAGYIRFFYAPFATGYSDTFSYSADIISEDNFYDLSTKSYIGKQLSVTKFSYSVASKENNVLLIDNIFDVRTTNNDPIFTVKRTYGINPRTGSHTKGYGDHDRIGYLFAPKNLHKQDFTYWHVNYDEPATMHFTKEETIDDLRVYLYESDYHADQTKDLTYLPEVGKTKGVDLDIHLKLWVEPKTGRLISYHDTTTAYYYDLQTKQRLYPWNQFTNTFNQDSVSQQTSLVKSQIILVQIYEIYLPLSLIGITGILLLLLFRRRIPYFSSGIYYLVPLLFFGTTFIIFFITNTTLYHQNDLTFSSDTTSILSSVTQRMDIYKNALQGAKGLFSASQTVERDEWKKYIDEINIQKSYPGIQGIGFAKAFPASQLQTVINSVRKDGYPTFTVFPDTPRSLYTSIIYLQPLDARNLRAFGYDMMTEPTRRRAMEIARDTGLPTVSGRVKLLQENGMDVQQGFLLYVPVYKNNTKNTTQLERRKNLEGYVYAPFRINDFLSSIINNLPSKITKGIDIEVYDGVNEISEETELFDYDEGKFSKNESYLPVFKKTQTIFIQGHPWTFRFISTPKFNQDILTIILPYFILFGGGIFSLSLVFLIYSQSIARRKAEKIAKEISRRDEAVLTSISEGVIVTDEKGIITLANDEATHILGFNKQELIGNTLSAIAKLHTVKKTNISSDERPITLALTKKTVTKPSVDQNFYYVKKDGTSIPISLAVAPVIVDNSVVGAVEVFRDVTSEKNATDKIVDKNSELERINKVMVDREIKMIELKKEIQSLKKSKK